MHLLKKDSTAVAHLGTIRSLCSIVTVVGAPGKAQVFFPEAAMIVDVAGVTDVELR